MRVSESWLREWLDPGVDTLELASRLTMAGLEVGAVESAAPPFEGVVVGTVTDCGRHPDADKLSVCTVDIGADEVLSIVCGAPNVREGIKVAVARVGARLPGGVKIRKAKLRGVPSQGMICSARELGLGEEHDGILVLPSDLRPGDDVRDALDLDDAILELELTPNRGDCLGMRGVARECGALFGRPLEAAAPEPVTATDERALAVRLEAPDACPRFAGRAVLGIDPGAQTPLWMVERLRRAGIRSLGPVVDVTNFVMIETGQPMHGFDLDRVQEGIVVRRARTGERLTLLDGKEVELGDDVLTICDERGPLAMAGIMGGEGSGVGDGTRNVFFESAFFAPLAIVGRARRYGLHTDASYRFERGVDPAGQVAALERATALLIDIAGGAAGPLCVAEAAEHLPARPAIELAREKLKSVLGINLQDDEITSILQRLGCAVDASGGHWRVTPPSHRFDLTVSEDLIEEVARVHGYERIGEQPEKVTLAMPPVSETRVPIARVQDALVDRGFQEVITYSFVDPHLHAVVVPHVEPLALANPISSDLAVMRASLWPGLIATLKHNLARQQERLCVFETGLVFDPSGAQLAQPAKVALAMTGARAPEHWDHGREAADFYDLSGHVQALLALCGARADVRVESAQHPVLHPGQSAQIYVNDTPVGVMGALHPQRAKTLELDAAVLLAELDVAGALAADVPKFSAISRFPASRRDLSIVVDESVTAAALTAAARAAAPTALRQLVVFDIYRGDAIDSGRKSVSLGLILQDSSRTLNDGEVDAAVHAVVAKLKRDFDGKIRD